MAFYSDTNLQMLMRFLYAALALVFFSLSASAQWIEEAPKVVPEHRASAPGPGECALGTANALLDVGGVRAHLSNVGEFFGFDDYEVPNGSRKRPLHSAGLWIGGEVDGEVRFAGSDFGPYEFWPGPLDSDGATNPAVCAQFDRIWSVSQRDIEAYDASGTTTDDLVSWPIAWGAPFYTDANGDGMNDPQSEPVTTLDLGDEGYGVRQIDLAAGERPLVYGSQTLWWVMNDNGGTHAWSGSDPLRVEVRVTAFGVSDPDRLAVHQSTFYRVSVHNRGAETIENTHVSFFSDLDLGYHRDDYVASDPSREMAYVYNAEEIDSGYGVPPPALGLDWLSGASAGMYWARDKLGTPYDPQGAEQAYRYQRALWPDGSPLVQAGNGYQDDGPETVWAFDGDPVTESFWTEENTDGAGSRSIPGDRRVLLSASPFALAPAASRTMDLALVFGRGENRLASVTALREADDEVQALYDSGALFRAVSPTDEPPPAPAPTQAPTLVSPVDVTIREAGAVRFEWTEVPRADSYAFELSTEEDFSSRQSFEVNRTAFDFPRLRVNSAEPWYWRVTPQNASGSGPVSEVRQFAYVVYVPGFTSFVVVANASGPLAEPVGAAAGWGGFPGPSLPVPAGDQQVSGASWLISSAGTATLDEFLETALRGDNATRVFPSDFEIRFTDTSMAYAEGGTLIPIPFEIWNIGIGTLDDPSDDYRMVPRIHDVDNDGTYNLSTPDSPVSGS